MLEHDPERRPTFIEILEKLPDYKLIKAHFLMNGDSLPVEVVRQQTPACPNPEVNNTHGLRHNIPSIPVDAISSQLMRDTVHSNNRTRLSSRSQCEPRAPEMNHPSKGLNLTSASKLQSDPRRQQAAYRSSSAPLKENTAFNTPTQPSPPQTSERLRQKQNPHTPANQDPNPLKRRNSLNQHRKSPQ